MKSKKILLLTYCILLLSINNAFASQSIQMNIQIHECDTSTYFNIHEKIVDGVSYLGSESNEIPMVIRYSNDKVYTGSVMKSADKYIKHGEGTLHTPNGKYIGKWDHDRLKEGIFDNYIDQIYQGEFNAKLEKNGYGEIKYLYNSGSIKSYSGYWKEDKQNDENGVFVDNDYNTYVSVWLDGKLVEIKKCLYDN